jgi:hypothetical protein
MSIHGFFECVSSPSSYCSSKRKKPTWFRTAFNSLMPVYVFYLLNICLKYLQESRSPCNPVVRTVYFGRKLFRSSKKHAPSRGLHSCFASTFTLRMTTVCSPKTSAPRRCVCVCACARARARVGARVCVCEREREREGISIISGTGTVICIAGALAWRSGRW